MPLIESASNGKSSRSLWDRWYVRVPLKWFVFAIVTAFTLFPYPAQTLHHLSHISNLEKMVEPDAPELARWDGEMARLREQARKTAATGRESEARAMQRSVEKFVLAQVKYEWDWNLWGSADYMPTVREMFMRAEQFEDGQLREDCDGRAVIAASLMRRLGYDSQIVTDLRHVWVVTKQGEWMGPGRMKTLRSTPQGNQADIWTTLSNAPVALSYGVAVFPFWREMIIAGTAFVLLLHRRTGWRSALLGGVLIVQGLLFMRLGFMAPERVGREISAWPSWIGLLHVAAGMAVLMCASFVARRIRRL